MLKLDWNILFTIINVIVLYLLLRKFLFKPVLSIMEKREKMIMESMSTAQKEREEAQMLMHEAQKQVDEVNAEAEAQAKQRREQAEREQRETLDETRQEAERILETSRKNALIEREKILGQSKDELVAAAIEAAKKVASLRTGDEENHQLFKELINEVGGTHEKQQN